MEDDNVALTKPSASSSANPFPTKNFKHEFSDSFANTDSDPPSDDDDSDSPAAAARTKGVRSPLERGGGALGEVGSSPSFSSDHFLQSTPARGREKGRGVYRDGGTGDGSGEEDEDRLENSISGILQRGAAGREGEEEEEEEHRLILNGDAVDGSISRIKLSRHSLADSKSSGGYSLNSTTGGRSRPNYRRSPHPPSTSSSTLVNEQEEFDSERGGGSTLGARMKGRRTNGEMDEGWGKVRLGDFRSKVDSLVGGSQGAEIEGEFSGSGRDTREEEDRKSDRTAKPQTPLSSAATTATIQASHTGENGTFSSTKSDVTTRNAGERTASASSRVHEVFERALKGGEGDGYSNRISNSPSLSLEALRSNRSTPPLRAAAHAAGYRGEGDISHLSEDGGKKRPFRNGDSAESLAASRSKSDQAIPTTSTTGLGYSQSSRNRLRDILHSSTKLSSTSPIGPESDAVSPSASLKVRSSFVESPHDRDRLARVLRQSRSFSSPRSTEDAHQQQDDAQAQANQSPLDRDMERYLAPSTPSAKALGKRPLRREQDWQTWSVGRIEGEYDGDEEEDEREDFATGHDFRQVEEALEDEYEPPPPPDIPQSSLRTPHPPGRFLGSPNVTSSSSNRFAPEPPPLSYSQARHFTPTSLVSPMSRLVKDKKVGTDERSVRFSSQADEEDAGAGAIPRADTVYPSGRSASDRSREVIDSNRSFDGGAEQYPLTSTPPQQRRAHDLSMRTPHIPGAIPKTPGQSRSWTSPVTEDQLDYNTSLTTASETNGRSSDRALSTPSRQAGATYGDSSTRTPRFPGALPVTPAAPKPSTPIVKTEENSRSLFLDAQNASEGQAVASEGKARAELSTSILNEGDASEQKVRTLLDQLVQTIAGMSSGAAKDIARDKARDIHRTLSTRKSSSDLRSEEFKKARGRLTLVKSESQTQQVDFARQISESDVTDRKMSSKIDEIKRAIEDMGSEIGEQLNGALRESFKTESKRRTSWLIFAVVFEIIVIWLMILFADYRATHYYQTVYFDPFYPALYLPPSTQPFLSYPSSLLPQRYSIFSNQDSSLMGQIFYYLHWSISFFTGTADFEHGSLARDATSGVGGGGSGDRYMWQPS